MKKQQNISKTFEWCGYQWKSEMEGSRLIDVDKPYEWFSHDATWVGYLGNLSLSIQTNPMEIKHWDGNTYRPLYGVGLARSVESFGCGTFSAEIILPKGSYLWPSFWLVGTEKWPDGGEIDVMEAWSDEYGDYFKWLSKRFPYITPGWNTTNNINYKKDGSNKTTGSKNIPWLKQTKDPTENFIKYEVEWTPESIVFKANGKIIRKYGKDVADCIKDKKMHVIFNLWTSREEFTYDSPMIVRNFKYREYEIH